MGAASSNLSCLLGVASISPLVMAITELLASHRICFWRQSREPCLWSCQSHCPIQYEVCPRTLGDSLHMQGRGCKWQGQPRCRWGRAPGSQGDCVAAQLTPEVAAAVLRRARSSHCVHDTTNARFSRALVYCSLTCPPTLLPAQPSAPSRFVLRRPRLPCLHLLARVTVNGAAFFFPCKHLLLSWPVSALTTRDT